MTCRKFERRWGACRADDLPPAAYAHLSSCAACAAKAQAASAAGAAQPIANANPAWATNRFARRGFLKIGFTGLLAGVMMRIRRSWGSARPTSASIALSPDAPVEYIVVGSGAGGAPVACNLAKAGHKVLLLEAGGDDADDVIAVPFFNAFAADNPAIQWNYFVQHYANAEQQQRDSKYLPDRDGVWYPRSGTLGGCTAHSFLTAFYPSNSDWDNIAQLTGDPSWNATNMRQYFEQLEQCRYVPRLPDGSNPSRHGFDGWQPTDIPDPAIFAQDKNILRLVRAGAQAVAKVPFRVFHKFFRAELDPNDWRVQEDREGLYNIPHLTRNGRRFGMRDLIRETAAALPHNLIVMTHTLATRVVFEGTKAIGVEYLTGPHLYRADPQANPEGDEPGPRQTIYASREVILAAGAFNTPQLLKLSGIGPKDELTSHGIEVLVDRPGVGENLQDRYEIGVVTELNEDFTFAEACSPGQPDDPCFAAWLQGRGVYTNNGGAYAIIWKSPTAHAAQRQDPDMFLGTAPARFTGYYPGYSVLDITATKNQFTWVILKAHTLNRAGTVKLRSADPREVPIITFHYFEEGTDPNLEDLAALVDSVEFVRHMNMRAANIIKSELIPGPGVQSREDIAQFVRNEAWGHHASCTAKIGPADDPMAVVDGDFRVHGTQNLRVVDASIFPKIPGYFILIPIYMISQKASAVILASAE